MNKEKLLILEQKHQHLISERLAWAVCTKEISILGEYCRLHFTMGGVCQLTLKNVWVDEICPTSLERRGDGVIRFGVICPTSSERRGAGVIRFGVKYKLPFLTWVCQIKNLFGESISLIAAFAGDHGRYLNIKTTHMDFTLVKPLPVPISIGDDMTPYVTMPRSPEVYDIDSIGEILKPIRELEKFFPLSIDSIKEECLDDVGGFRLLCSADPTELLHDKSIDLNVRWKMLKMLVVKHIDNYYVGEVYRCLPNRMAMIDKVIQ